MTAFNIRTLPISYVYPFHSNTYLNTLIYLIYVLFIMRNSNVVVGSACNILLGSINNKSIQLVDIIGWFRVERTKKKKKCRRRKKDIKLQSKSSALSNPMPSTYCISYQRKSMRNQAFG